MKRILIDHLPSLSERSVSYMLPGWQLNLHPGEEDPENPGNYFPTTPVLGDVESTYVLETENVLYEIAAGRPSRTYSDTGTHVDYDYDDDNWVIYKKYADGTFESFCYNAEKQITRYRERSGDVTRKVYDSAGNLTELHEGLHDHSGNTASFDPYGGITYNRCATNDVQTTSYSVAFWQYNSSGKLTVSIDALGNQTDYAYDSVGRLVSITQPSDAINGTRAETEYAYDVDTGRLIQITDPVGRETYYVHDDCGRLIQTTFDDASSERTFYSSTGTTAGSLTKKVDRNGIVTNYVYDDADRLTEVTLAAAYMSPGGTESALSDGSTPVVTQLSYLPGSERRAEIEHAGSLTELGYDFRGRLISTAIHARQGKTLVSSTTYLDNQPFTRTDAYGRKTYYSYDATDGRRIRTIQGTVPSYSLTNFAAVLSETRNTSANAPFVIEDTVYDTEGRPSQRTDGRGTETRTEFDALGRVVRSTEGYGTSLAAITETDYDDAGNVLEVRSPRYFDSSDADGYQSAKETWTYTGRRLPLSHTEAPGTSVAGTESFTYTLDGQRATRTDFRGKVWSNYYQTCCARHSGSMDPLGHGSIINMDPIGRTVHEVQVADYSTHATPIDPTDAKTLRETTTLYNALGRPKASTVWLVACGTIDPLSPPIAGLGSISAAEGLTTQYLYDDNLTDGVGLDSSGGVSYTKTAASGTSSVSLASAITQLAASQSNGGVGISFDTDAPGRAVVTINPQDEVSFRITDATGQMVMSGQLDNYTGTANALHTWTCTLQDTVTNVSSFGDCLETISIDALGKATKRLVDGAGRTIKSIDQLGKITSCTYDASGNRLSVRDPNNVGQDVVYDALGRAGLSTDTAGDTTNSAYDKAGNRIAAIDGKSNSTVYAFDARGRQKSQTDRLSGTTSFTYSATGQLASLTDAESQTTSYTYDDAGRKLTETYPDHTGGTPGQSTYGIVTFTNDPAGRVLRKQDQKGDTSTNLYDLADRLTQRDYRTLANSPSSTITDSDAFTYDKAGRMLTAVSGRYSNTVTYTYDTAGRKATEALTISGQTYTTATGYNARGELTNYTYPDSTSVSRSYTDRGQLYQLTHASTTIDTRTYDNGGRLTGSAYNNGVSETRSYNADNTLSGISFTGASIGNLSYAWDNNKNKTSETVGGTMSGYGFSVGSSGYDDEDRLVNYNRTDGNLDQSWTLSEVGDWDSVTTEGTAQSRTHGPAHELTAGGGSSVSTDAKGNITLIPSVLRPNSSSLLLNWDFDNRLSTADVGNNSSIDVAYKFDALGRRVFRDDGTNAVVYVHSGEQTIADYAAGTAASSPTYRYVYASYVDEPVLRYKPAGTESLYYHRNQQYSITALTNGSGSIVERYAYSAYGAPTITNGSGSVLSLTAYGNRYAYTGREWDPALHIYHYRARMYDPSLGRFCSRDPIGFDGSQFNLFAYVKSQPLDLTDPSGLFWGDVWGNFCGPIANGQNGPAIDNLDKACEAHDDCLATFREFMIPCNVLRCDMKLCLATFNPFICSGSPRKIACLAAQAAINSYACNPYFGTTPFTSPLI